MPTNKIELKILDERLHDWGLPRYQTEMSAGIDLYACLDEPLVLEPQAPAVLVRSGIALLMNDPHMVGFLLARSGLGHKKGLVLGQSVGTIDADYRGEVKIILINLGDEPFAIARGDRVAQLVVAPVQLASFAEVDSLDDTARGQGGFGSTGV